jgi:hypothetical protein
MTFKAATCPSCGGALQVLDNRTTVKCVYFYVDVIVREDTQSAVVKAKEGIAGTGVKSTATAPGFAKALIGFGVLALLFSIALLAQAYDKTYGAVTMVVALVLIITGVINSKAADIITSLSGKSTHAEISITFPRSMQNRVH